MGRRVIFIGPDCSGKSTIAARVGEQLGIEVKAHRRIKDPLVATIGVCIEPIAAMSKIGAPAECVYDQWMFPVDIIYQMSLGNEPSPFASLHDELAARYKEAGYIFVYVTADDDTLRSRYAERGDELWDIEQILRVSAAYEAYYETNLNMGAHHMIKLDTTNKPVEECVSEVMIALEEKFKAVLGGKAK